MKYVKNQDKIKMRCHSYSFDRSKEAAYILNTFFLARLSYCPLVCGLCSRTK